MHVFQGLKFNCFVPFLTDFRNEDFDVVSELSEPIIDIFPVEVIVHFWKHEFSLFLFFEGAPTLIIAKESLLFVHYINFIIENANKFMKHSLISPGGQEGRDNIFFSLCYKDNSPLIKSIITLLFS